MSEFDYDLFVIGAGSGGVRASRIASSYGAKVAVAEEYRIGGTCVIRGCVPKKMLVYGSMFAEELEHAANYGWTIGETSFDWGKLRDFVNADVDRLEGLYGKTLESHKVERFLERATVTGPHGIMLASGKEITAKYILVATGGWPVMPTFPGAEHCISSNEVFHLPEQPKRLVVQARAISRWSSPACSTRSAATSPWSTAARRSCAAMTRGSSSGCSTSR